jgi:glutathione S-transferase
MGLLDASTIAVELRQEHGFVLLALLATVFVHYWYMAAGVSAARKKYGVKYPTLYAESSNPQANDFNCVQRGHQNSLEQLPHFLSVFAAAAIKYPIPAAVAALVYNVGKFVYFKGYSTGKPSARNRGAFSYFALLALYVQVIMFANSLLKLTK